MLGREWLVEQLAPQPGVNKRMLGRLRGPFPSKGQL
jgi:hypothetical protein